MNVGGTVNVLDAAKTRGIQVAYASSAAVYSQVDDTGGPVPNDAVGHPTTFYGVHKQACEGLARIFWQEEQVPSIGIRPFIVYGPGRDPASRRRRPRDGRRRRAARTTQIAFGGRTQLQFAPDTARVFVAAARAATEGARVFHLGGPAVRSPRPPPRSRRPRPTCRSRSTRRRSCRSRRSSTARRSTTRSAGSSWTPLADGVSADDRAAASRAG